MIPRAKKSAINENDLMMYLAVALKHLRLMVLLGCLSFAAGLVYYNFSRPIYYAVSLVDFEVVERTASTPDVQRVYRDSTTQVIMAALASDHLKERVARKFGINLPAKEIDKKHLKRVRPKFNSERDILIEVWAYSHDLARDWGETLIQEYILDREEKRIIRTQTMMETFNKEMDEVKARMDQWFETKNNFRDTNKLTQILIELSHMREIPRELTRVKHQIGMMEQRRDILENQNLNAISKLSLLSSLDKDIQTGVDIGQVLSKDEKGAIVVVPQMVDSTLKKPWEDLDRDRRLLQQKYDMLGQTFLEKHPNMLAIKKQIDDIDRRLAAEVEFAMNRFQVNYENLLNRKSELEEKLPAVQEINRRYEKAEREYNNLDSTQLAWGRMLSEMEKRLNAIDFGNDKERVILRYAGYSEPLRDYPISPNRMKLMIYSILVGLALAVAVPFLIEYLDSRVSDVEQVEETLRIRGLGVVPKIEEHENDGLYLLGDQKPDYHLQENFRVIRTNLVINSETASLPQVIVVTSAMPQEGKTVVSSNLAMSFAMKGEKTLLIDADLRRGRLHRLFGAHNKPGISDVLRDKKPLEEAFRTTGHENLTLLTCGKHLNSASELLDSPSFVRLMEELRQKYQRIIVDTPPVLGLAETAIIQRISDGVLFVIWSEFTPMRNVKAAIQSLQTNGAKFCGFVLNRLDFHALGNRYKYFYYAPNYYTNYKAIEAPVVAES